MCRVLVGGEYRNRKILAMQYIGNGKLVLNQPTL